MSGGCRAGRGTVPSTTRARRPPTAGTTGTEAARTAEGSASVSFANACLRRGEPDGWRSARGSPGDQVRTSTSTTILRRSRCRHAVRGRAVGDTKTPRSRHARKLARVAVVALREWQRTRRPRRWLAGSRWWDIGRSVGLGHDDAAESGQISEFDDAALIVRRRASVDPDPRVAALDEPLRYVAPSLVLVALGGWSPQDCRLLRPRRFAAFTNRSGWSSDTNSYDRALGCSSWPVTRRAGCAGPAGGR
jgi:hypothetical protein